MAGILNNVQRPSGEQPNKRKIMSWRIGLYTPLDFIAWDQLDEPKGEMRNRYSVGEFQTLEQAQEVLTRLERKKDQIRPDMDRRRGRTRLTTVTRRLRRQGIVGLTELTFVAQEHGIHLSYETVSEEDVIHDITLKGQQKEVQQLFTEMITLYAFAEEQAC